MNATTHVAGLCSIGIPVSDFERATILYTSKLGFSEGESGMGGGLLHANTVSLFLTPSDGNKKGTVCVIPTFEGEEGVKKATRA